MARNNTTSGSSLEPVRVWDLPTRIFHWALACFLVSSVLRAWLGGNAMVWHFRLGYAVFALLAFRLVWGLVGGRWSRFAAFVYAPSTTLRYLRGEGHVDEHLHVGHNPLGAFSVFGLIGILALQVGTGLFADDEISNSGPLLKYVSGATSSLLTSWHKNFGQWLIVGLVVLHIAAVLFYLVKKKQNLVGPMLTGDKLLAGDVPPSTDHALSRGIALVLFALCAAGVAWVIALGD
ncbi:cytochrome b/b6 domain-containing protein [soil metagenome]